MLRWQACTRPAVLHDNVRVLEGARQVPVLFLMGLAHTAVGFSSWQGLRTKASCSASARAHHGISTVAGLLQAVGPACCQNHQVSVSPFQDASLALSHVLLGA